MRLTRHFVLSPAIGVLGCRISAGCGAPSTRCDVRTHKCTSEGSAALDAIALSSRVRSPVESVGDQKRDRQHGEDGELYGSASQTNESCAALWMYCNLPDSTR